MYVIIKRLIDKHFILLLLSLNLDESKRKVQTHKQKQMQISCPKIYVLRSSNDYKRQKELGKCKERTKK